MEEERKTTGNVGSLSEIKEKKKKKRWEGNVEKKRENKLRNGERY